MSTISNRFFVTALEDGATLHGNLTSKQSLTQAYNGSGCIPDWTVVANQPEIYLTLLSGGSYETPNSTFTWSVNGEDLEFDNITNISTGGSYSGIFQKTTETIEGKTMPSLTIIGNLANTSTSDILNVMFSGSWGTGNSAVDFTATTQIRLTKISGNGYFGVLSFLDRAEIIEQSQTVTVVESFYGGAEASPLVLNTDYAVKWYLNGVEQTGASGTGTIEPVIVSGHSRLAVTGSHIVDYATVSCEFYKKETGKPDELVYTAYVGIDDMQDDEYLYIQVANANENNAALRKNGSVEFRIWVGKKNDPAISTTTVGGNTSVTWPFIYAKLLESTGNVSVTNFSDSGIPNVISSTVGNPAYGQRLLPLYESSDATADEHDDIENTDVGKAHIKLTYAEVKSLGYNVTGIITASMSNLYPSS